MNLTQAGVIELSSTKKNPNHLRRVVNNKVMLYAFAEVENDVKVFFWNLNFSKVNYLLGEVGNVLVEGVGRGNVTGRSIATGVRGELTLLKDQLEQREHGVAKNDEVC